MTKFKSKLIPGILASFAWVGVAQAETVNAASCSQADVASAVSSATAGDTVQVPAGTCSWSGGISFAGISLIGAGSSAAGTVVTDGLVTVTKHDTEYTRLSGFRFTGTDEHIRVDGSPTAKPYLVDNNHVRADVSGRAVQLTANGGVLHHNELVAEDWTNADVFNIPTSEDWTQAPTFGADDTSGERNIYFEDNTFTNIVETMPDGDMGSRLVIRHNLYVDSSIVFHGGAPNDSSPNGGTRQFEVYENTFDRVENSVALNKWVWARGSSGVIANNQMESADSPDGSTYPNKPEILLTVGCPDPYPMQYQVGQSNQSPENPPTHPLAIFGNTGAGTTDSNFISVAGSDTAGPPCATPDDYIQEGRDYVFSNTWGWTPYQYPHPLAGGGAGTGGSGGGGPGGAANGGSGGGGAIAGGGGNPGSGGTAGSGASDSADDGGCGCRLQSAGRSSSGVLLLFLPLCAFLRRRARYTSTKSSALVASCATMLEVSSSRKTASS